MAGRGQVIRGCTRGPNEGDTGLCGCSGNSFFKEVQRMPGSCCLNASVFKVHYIPKDLPPSVVFLYRLWLDSMVSTYK